MPTERTPGLLSSATSGKPLCFLDGDFLFLLLGVVLYLDELMVVCRLFLQALRFDSGTSCLFLEGDDFSLVDMTPNVVPFIKIGSCVAF